MVDREFVLLVGFGLLKGSLGGSTSEHEGGPNHPGDLAERTRLTHVPGGVSLDICEDPRSNAAVTSPLALMPTAWGLLEGRSR